MRFHGLIILTESLQIAWKRVGWNVIYRSASVPHNCKNLTLIFFDIRGNPQRAISISVGSFNLSTCRNWYRWGRYAGVLSTEVLRQLVMGMKLEQPS